MGTVADLIYALLQPSCQCGSAPRILLSPGWEDREGEVRGGSLKKKKKKVEGKKNNSSKAWIFDFLPDQIPPFQEINLGMR